MKTPTYKYNGIDYKVTSIDFENNEFSIIVDGKDKFIQNNLLIKWSNHKGKPEQNKQKQRISFKYLNEVKAERNLYAQTLNYIYDAIPNNIQDFQIEIKNLIKKILGYTI